MTFWIVLYIKVEQRGEKKQLQSLEADQTKMDEFFRIFFFKFSDINLCKANKATTTMPIFPIFHEQEEIG